MGKAELIKNSHRLVIHSIFYFYGGSASRDISELLAADISSCWNQPSGRVMMLGEVFGVEFDIEGFHVPDLKPETVWYNDEPQNNYFRVEEFSFNDTSFVDGIGCNTGYFKLANLLGLSHTAAHEYGHSLGLEHPEVLDIRGMGQPGMMYPRGTLCDPLFQYDPKALPGQPGGTLSPGMRKVLQTDIDNLKLSRLSFSAGWATVGGFSSIYHDKHLPPA